MFCRNIPLAIFIALPLVIVLYLLVNISYFTVMSIDELVDSPAVGIVRKSSVLVGITFDRKTHLAEKFPKPGGESR